jgi:hypothetical protein
MNNLICPISNDKVDNNCSRLTTFIIALLIAGYLFTGIPYFILFVAVDYSIRALGNRKYSPVMRIAGAILTLIKFPKKMVSHAPKLFASRIGLLFSAVSIILFPFAFSASIIVAGILFVFTALDSVSNVCFGCITYTYVVLPLYKKRMN